MNAIEQIRRDHEDLARVLKKYALIRKFAEDLYPDSAHFIYELLQNAEDADATEAAFVLSNDVLVFEHNGRTFNEFDIQSITDIGEGTKADDEERIGRFGIGFKAVFAYTETPRVWSPSYAFEIREMVLPWEIPSNPDLVDRTRFEFPFNSSKKPPSQAFLEVQAGLRDIADNTLLFLSNIEEIQWSMTGREEGRLLRNTHSDHHVEILRETAGRPTTSSHFLRFTEPVKDLDRQFVAIAFELEPQSNKEKADAPPRFAEQFRIVPADRGRVAVYFTAEKETSNLHFHLHAPFVPELSRSSIKDTPANEPLYRQLAELAARSLCQIRDLRLLNRDFLAVLPNSEDGIPKPYQIIREAIVDTMNKQPLTPTNTDGHAPACQLLQAEAGLKRLLNRGDIRFLVDDKDRRNWAAAATQRNNRVDRILNHDLDIKRWGTTEFLETLDDRCSNAGRWCQSDATWKDDPDPIFLDWMRRKPVDWHRSLYAFFYREFENKLERFDDICIVRLSDGQFRIGSECYFPTQETQPDPIHPRVAEDTYIYTDGARRKVQRGARAFLENIGVREIGESEQIETVLKRRYANPNHSTSWETHETDLRRFIALVEKNRQETKLFKDYYIFQKSGGGWSRPGGVYLDTPHLETMLQAYYFPLGSESDRSALTDAYMDFDMRPRLIEFAKLCGVAYRLEISPSNCYHNPEWAYLSSAPGIHRYDTNVDLDFVILQLATLLKKPNLDLSCLIWKTLCDSSNDKMKATYQKNQSNDPHTAASQLVHQLRNAAWVPQGDGRFVRPVDASRDLLPDGFPFDSGWAWLDAICFGAETEELAERYRRKQKVAAELGFESDDELEDGLKFVKRVPPEVRRKMLEEYTKNGELPTSKPRNPDRRAENIRKKARSAPERTTKISRRSISGNRDVTKKEKTDPYLRELYTNVNGITFCQACRDGLPFRLGNGNYYFEAVEFLPELKKHHYQNYLALCPNHAAMFMHANDSRSEIKDGFNALDGNELTITLAGEPVFLYFTDTHAQDLKNVIDVDDEE